MSTVIHDVTRFGAVADGKTVNTKSIQAAVDACAEAGGGRVVVPGGVFLSGAIFLKSGVEFHLADGAVLRGVQDVDAFPPLHVQARGYDIRHWRASLLTAMGEADVAITGCGTLDGQGAAWWVANAVKQRAPLVQINDCERVLVRDIRAANSPMWTIRFFLSRDVTVDRVKVQNPWDHYYNNDGINFVSCQDVRVTDCHIDTGDDGITIKSVPDYHLSSTDGKVDLSLPAIPCENILVSGCIVRHAHGGVVIGSETVGGVRDVVVSHCIFEGTRAGIKVKGSTWGGFVRNVRVSGVVMKRVEMGVEIQSREGYEEVKPVREVPSAVIEDIHFSNLSMTRCFWGIVVKGRPDAPVRNLSFRGMSMDADGGIQMFLAEEVELQDLRLDTRGPAVIARDCRILDVRRVSTRRAAAGQPMLDFARVEEARVIDCCPASVTKILLGKVGRANRRVVLRDNRLPAGCIKEGSVKPAAEWLTSSHAFSGSSAKRRLKGENPQLPIPKAELEAMEIGSRRPWLLLSWPVLETVEGLWSRKLVDGIFAISRAESGSRPRVKLPPRDFRRLYILQSTETVEKLIIAEDGELIERIADVGFLAYTEQSSWR